MLLKRRMLNVELRDDSSSCLPSRTPQPYNKRSTEEEEATMMRRKCAKSIYELSTRPDKGPLLVENGVLEALSVLSGVGVSSQRRYYIGTLKILLSSYLRVGCVYIQANSW